MMPAPLQPCPLCGQKPKLYEANHLSGKMWTLSCVGDKHCVAIYKIGSPDETVAEWDRRLAPARHKAGEAA